MSSVAFSPMARPRGRIRRGGGGGVVLWDAAVGMRLRRIPLPVEGGLRLERRLQPRRQDPGNRVRLPQ